VSGDEADLYIYIYLYMRRVFELTWEMCIKKPWLAVGGTSGKQIQVTVGCDLKHRIGV
jgi:hypothetical protein